MQTDNFEDIPFEEIHEIEKYGSHYSDRKLWEKIMRIAKKVGATILRPVLQLYYLLQDENVPARHKTYILGALGYFILPIDLIPEVFFSVVGFTDDLAVMTFVLKMVHDSITPEINEKVEKKLSEILHLNKI